MRSAGALNMKRGFRRGFGIKGCLSIKQVD